MNTKTVRLAVLYLAFGVALAVLLAGCGGAEVIPLPVETSASASPEGQVTLAGPSSATALPATGPLTTLTPTQAAPTGVVASATAAPATPAAATQAQPGGGEAALNTPFSLQMNQTARIASEDVQITFTRVKEDSRCPKDVECIWEGQAVVVVKVVKDNQDLGSIELTSRAGQDELAIQYIDSLAIKLVEVTPYPSSGQSIDPAAYTITLLVTPQ